MYRVLIVLFLFLSTGCVTSRFNSSLNPDFSGKQYHCILIQFPDMDLDLCRYNERTAKGLIDKRFGGKMRSFLCSDEFYLGLRPAYKMRDDMKVFVRKEKIEAVLIGFNLGRNRQQNMIPGVPGHKGKTTAPMAVTQNVMDYRLELFDLKTGQSVWFATCHFQGDAVVTFKNMMSMFLKKAINDLDSKGIIASAEESEGGEEKNPATDGRLDL